MMIVALIGAGSLGAQTDTGPGAGQEVREDGGAAAGDAAPAEKAVKKEAPAPEPVKAHKAAAKEARREAAKKEEPVQAQNTADLRDAGGLLDLQEGDFLYRRIPDKKFTESNQAGLEGFDVGASIQPAGAETPEMSQRKGLFGLSAESTNYIAKGMLLFIIVLIIVLYRLRSRTRRSTVHKSFR